MTAEPIRTEIQFTKDPRLIAGVRSVIERMGEMDGFSDRERIALADACEQACREACTLGANGDLCRVAVDNFGDRIEICLDYAGKTLPFAPGGTPSKQPFDEARMESRNGSPCLKLVKYRASKPAHP